MKKSAVKKISWGAAAVAVTLCCAWGLWGRSRTASVQKTTVAMGSVVTQTVCGSSEAAAEKAAAAAVQRINELEQRISCKLEGSEISAVNRASGTPVPVSADTAALLRDCLRVEADTAGRYTICVRPLTLLWDFDAAVFAVPDTAARAQAAALVSASACTADGTAVTLTPAGAGLDLGSAGKGAACDAALAAYAETGCSAAIVSVGGSIGLFGAKPDGSAWTVGVRDPARTATDTLGTLSLRSGCVSTSGTYEKMREANGVQYHHLLDPATGLPAQTDLVSATVVCQSGALSDILATACVVLGRDEGEALLRAYGASYLLIGTDHAITLSDDLRSAFALTAEGYTLR